MHSQPKSVTSPVKIVKKIELTTYGQDLKMATEQFHLLLQDCNFRRGMFLQNYEWMEQLTQLKSKLLQRPFELNIARDPDEEPIMKELTYLHDSPQEEAIQYIRNHLSGKFMDTRVWVDLRQQITQQNLWLASDIVTGYVRSCFARCYNEDFHLLQHLNRIFPVNELHLNYYSLDKVFLYARKVAQDRGDLMNEYSRRAGKSLLQLQGYLPANQYWFVASNAFERMLMPINMSWKVIAVFLMILANTVIGLIEQKGGVSEITTATTNKVAVLINEASSSLTNFLNDFNNWEVLDAVNLNEVGENFPVMNLFEDEAIPEPHLSNFEDYIPPVNSPMFKGCIPPPLPALTTLAFTKLPGTNIQEKRDFFAGKGVHKLHQFDYFD